jgi:hypothetical protein
VPPVWSDASIVAGAAPGGIDASKLAAPLVAGSSGAAAMQTGQPPATGIAAGQPAPAATEATVEPTGSGQEGVGDDEDVLSGFELDANTGLLYSTTLGRCGVTCRSHASWYVSCCCCMSKFRL